MIDHDKAVKNAENWDRIALLRSNNLFWYKHHDGTMTNDKLEKIERAAQDAQRRAAYWHNVSRHVAYLL